MYTSDFWTQLPNIPCANQLPAVAPAKLQDYDPEPFAVNIVEADRENNNFRTALLIGHNLKLTLMSIKVGEDIGLEVHPHLDQFLRIEQG